MQYHHILIVKISTISSETEVPGAPASELRDYDNLRSRESSDVIILHIIVELFIVHYGTLRDQTIYRLFLFQHGALIAGLWIVWRVTS